MRVALSALIFVLYCAPASSFQVSQSRRSLSRRTISNNHDESTTPLFMSSRVDSLEGNSRTWNQRSTTTRGGPISLPSSYPSSPQSTALQRQQRPKQTDPINQNQPSRRQRKTKPLPMTGYDSKAIEELYDRRPLQVGWRLNSLGFPLLGWYMSLLMDRSTGAAENENIQRLRGEQLRMHLIRSKSVALIKVCGTICVMCYLCVQNDDLLTDQ